MKNSEQKIEKRILQNGLTVLVRPTHQIPKVSCQLWYNVGSKDEKLNEKGIAHLIEHMIFKGTDELSESDINLITTKLSGYTNAFTSYDYTGYLFDFPSSNWQEALKIMADCMQNAKFDQEHLNSEVKAVIQELKMYKDNYVQSLIESMISTIFPDHPYHYPIIGFKHDLWELKREKLVNFYKKHYVPNNATLIVVGDVNSEEVFQQAERYFGQIPEKPDYKKEDFFHSNDIAATSVTMYRDVQQPSILFAFKVPGARTKLEYALEVISWILGVGKSSRLYKKLVDELQLATEVETFLEDLFDHGLLFIYVQPKQLQDFNRIIYVIQKELADLAQNGPSKEEVEKAAKQCQVNFYSLLENNQKQAYFIGKTFLALGEENYLFDYFNFTVDELHNKIPDIVNAYLRPSMMHTGIILPLEAQDKPLWQMLQKESDELDQKILSNIQRETPVQEGKYVKTIELKKGGEFDFPKPTRFTLSNGLNVLYYHNPNIPKIDVALELKAKHYYDPENLLGLNAFMNAMLLEGTKKHSGSELAEAIESEGISIRVAPGYIGLSTLENDFKKGLNFLHEIVTESTFEESAVEKVRTQIEAELKNYWDEPTQFSNQLAREKIYVGHPYSKAARGTFESVAKIRQADLIDCYKANITPQDTTIAIVGDLSNYDVRKVLEEQLGSWTGPKVSSLTFPTLQQPKPEIINYPMQRDQIVLCYAGLSINRENPDFDKVLLFDQVFGGGVLGSMSSRLFQLREQSGLFYTINGSLLHHSDEQPGMVMVKTIVSLDRLQEAEKAIEHTIDTAANYLEDFELEEAKNALTHSLIDNFAANKSIASAFLFLQRYKLADDYFDNRRSMLDKISKEDVLSASKKLLDSKKMVKIRVGRV